MWFHFICCLSSSIWWIGCSGFCWKVILVMDLPNFPSSQQSALTLGKFIPRASLSVWNHSPEIWKASLRKEKKYHPFCLLYQKISPTDYEEGSKFASPPCNLPIHLDINSQESYELRNKLSWSYKRKGKVRRYAFLMLHPDQWLTTEIIDKII